MTIQPEHKIIATGLDAVRNVVPKGFNVHYHFVLVLLIYDEAKSQIPQWRHVLRGSKDQTKVKSWNRGNLRQYVMFVPKEELLKPLSKD